jgi:hypothetical protein
LDIVFDKIITYYKAKAQRRVDDLLSVRLRVWDEREFEFPFGTENKKQL